MSLSAREREALATIAEGLEWSDPRLAWMLAAFSQLTAGYDMPVRERLRPGEPHAGAAGREQIVVMLWVAVAVVALVLVVLAVVALMAGYSGQWASCTGSFALACRGLVGPRAGRRRREPVDRLDSAQQHRPARVGRHR